MKVRLAAAMVGNDFVYQVGHLLETSTDEAQRLVDGGLADFIEVDEPAAVEAAALATSSPRRIKNKETR